MRKKGFAIILVLAVLMLLALLAITYITLSLTDRTIARNYMDQIRAKMIAQSGIDYCISRFSELLAGNRLFTDNSWKYNPVTDSPSFVKGSVIINGKTKGYSESAGSTYEKDKDIFILKIQDTSSQINVNDGLGNNRVKENTKRILNALGDVAGITTLGDKIINNRPPQGYTSKQELRKVVNETEFETTKNLVTPHSWQDPNVANPVPLASAVIGDYPVMYNTNLSGAIANVYRYGRGYGLNAQGKITLITDDLKYAPTFTTGNSNNHGIYGLDELNPQWIEIVSRAPVNVNTASNEVLIALLKDLKGFFISDRRRDWPYYWNNYELGGDKEALKYTYNYSPTDPKGDELGFLYTTRQIETSLAAGITQEIKNCRDKIGTYGTAWFGGQFKTWRQFNAFCDNLVEGLLKDSRTIFYEYELDPLNPDYPFDTTVQSEVARKQASQAMADCLKANFNPNLHLNELNPDANIKALVDKTDLIVNSTEFCFTPMGYFEIESEGFILMGDQIIARQKINALAKIYDVARYTDEKQFLDGISAEELEIGPEPSKADASARQNEWGGYITLATVDGPDPHPQATFYSHFSKDFRANYHADSDSYKSNIITSNVEDRTEKTPGIKGPYTYNLDYRLARSFRKASDVNTQRAPCDLRIDGAYVERHAGLAYGFNGTNTLVFQNPGILCYWVKPSFYPESTGKPRTFFSLTESIKVKKQGDFIDDSRIFANFFLPAHWPDAKLTDEGTTPQYMAPEYGFNSMSLFFGYCTYDGINSPYGGLGHTTPFLNHLSHYDSLGNPLSCHPLGSSPKTNYLKSGQWIHIACLWNMPSGNPPDAPAVDTYSQIWINGNKISGSAPIYAHPGFAKITDFLSNSFFRIGEPADGVSNDGIRNWTSDSTIDEFYVFIADPAAPDKIVDLTNKIRNMYERSRYYRLENETNYISATLDLVKQSNIPSWSTIDSPSIFGSIADTSLSRMKVTGLSWTYYSEGTNAQGAPIIGNYKDFSADPPVIKDLTVNIKISILRNYNPATGSSEAEYGPFDDDGYSSASVEIASGANYRYKVTFKINGVDPSTVLLYSPIFDDITIYYTSPVRYVAYTYFD